MSIGDVARFLAAHVSTRLNLDDRGSSLTEYALLVALIAVVCLGSIAFMRTSASTKFQRVGSSIGQP